VASRRREILSVKTLLISSAIVISLAVNFVLLWQHFVLEPADKKVAEYHARYNMSSSRSSVLIRCANSACKARATLPGSSEELKKWMVEANCYRAKGLGDCFIDGFGTPFEFTLDKNDLRGMWLVITSAGPNQRFEPDDPRFTSILSVK